ncbi:hypothetical protein D3C81_1780080 [compost metagenome]
MVSSQQLLGHAAAVIVCQQVHRLVDLEVGKQRLLQVGLLDQAVAMVERLGRIAKAEHVAGDEAKALGQRRPEVMPIPTCRRESMQKQQGLSLPCGPVADALAPE